MQDAVNEAWQKRPELQQANLNLENTDIEVRATKNALLPVVNLFGLYTAQGLGGVQKTTVQTPTGVLLAGTPIVTAAGGAGTVGTPVLPAEFSSTAQTTLHFSFFREALGTIGRGCSLQNIPFSGRNKYYASDPQSGGPGG